ncbi:hypothetical protein DDI_3625 [Dickeya dianthicola RNS04.9]|nr:hypothetical protein DDI_3625 [Dickeya dianthicola RNS04.9]
MKRVVFVEVDNAWHSYRRDSRGGFRSLSLFNLAATITLAEVDS